MDAVHCPDDRISVSELTNVSDFMKQWIELLKDTHFKAIAVSADGEDAYMRESMNLSAEAVKEVANDCRIDNLMCEGEIDSKESRSTLDTASCNLATLRVIDQVNKRSQESRSFKQHMSTATKYQFYDPSLRVYTAQENSGERNVVSEKETILTVNVYQPYRKESTAKCANLKLEQEIEVLGSQCLTELRDRITCLSDVSVLGDFSENPDLPQDVRAKNVWTSGFFYINGVFYNDMRKPQSRDNSKVIIDWATKETDLNIGPFESRKMEETTFQDLIVRLGYPYVYQHQGNCEHLLVFRDLRMVTPSDSQDKSSYPHIHAISRRRRVICLVCHMMTARWVTTGNDQLTQDPFFFCDACFRSFNYTSDKEKIGSFQAHPFFDRSALL